MPPTLSAGSSDSLPERLWRLCLISQSSIPNPQSSIPNPQSSILDSQSSTIDPQCSIPNSQSSTFDPQYSIPNPQSSILHPQSQIPNPQPSTLNTQSSILDSRFSTFDPQCSIPNPQFQILNLRPSILHPIPSILNFESPSLNLNIACPREMIPKPTPQALDPWNPSVNPQFSVLKLSNTQTLDIPNTGMYFSLLNAMSSAWTSPSSSDKDGKLSGPSAFAAGFLSRSVASVTLLPLTIVKTRFEAGQNKVWSGIGVFTHARFGSWEAGLCASRSSTQRNELLQCSDTGSRFLWVGTMPLLRRARRISGNGINGAQTCTVFCAVCRTDPAAALRDSSQFFSMLCD